MQMIRAKLAILDCRQNISLSPIDKALGPKDRWHHRAHHLLIKARRLG